MKNCYTLLVVFTIFCGNVFGIGTDIILRNQPLIDQQKVEIDIAYNGWMFAAFSTVDSATNKGGITILRSKNNGYIWTNFAEYSNTDVRYSDFDILVAGTDSNALTLFVADVNKNLTTGLINMSVARYNAKTGAALSTPFTYFAGVRMVYDVELASDYKFPSVSSIPYSVAVAYTTTSTLDSVNFALSVDGGNTFTTKRNIATSPNYLRNVSIAYGKSLSAANGRYFLAWEELASSGARNGHIFSARNSTLITTAFTAPICIDSADAELMNKCRNPRIAVQQSSTIDNDSGSLTALVAVDRDYTGNGTDYDILGICNSRSHSGNSWHMVKIDNTGSNTIQNDLTYNPDSAMFVTTFLDTSNMKLRCYTHGIELIDPNSAWNQRIVNYDDATLPLATAFPRVAINPKLGKPAFAWIKKNTNGRGTTAFDADFAVYPSVNKIYDSICYGTTYDYLGYHFDEDVVIGNSWPAVEGNDSQVYVYLTVLPEINPLISSSVNLLSTDEYSHYQWFLNGNIISSANSQSYVAVIIGTYTVSVTDYHGCSDTSAAVVVDFVGIEQLSAAGIKVYPNPVCNIVNIEMPVGDKAIAEIIDVQGKVVISASVTGIQTIDVSKLSKGIYVLQLNTDTKRISTRLIK